MSDIVEIGQFNQYKQFVGSIALDRSNGLYCGKLTNAQDLITYCGNTVEEMYEEYKRTVDNYIEEKRKVVDCCDDLFLGCTFHCLTCPCRDCDERYDCQSKNAPCGCGR